MKLELIGFLSDRDRTSLAKVASLLPEGIVSEKGWAETSWASMAKKDGSLQIGFGLGAFPNVGIRDAYAGLSVGTSQFTVRTLKPVGDHDSETSIGTIRYEVLDDPNRIRLSLLDNASCPIAFELEYKSTLPWFFEERQLLRSAISGARVADAVRCHQRGSVSGWISIEGIRQPIDSGDWVAFRDHAWGMRPDIGRVPATQYHEPIAENRSASYMQLWCLMFFEREDGSQYMVHFYLVKTRERDIHVSGHLNFENGTQVPAEYIEVDLTYDDSTRQPEGGTVHLTVESGETLCIEINAYSNRTGFHLGAGRHLGYAVLDGIDLGLSSTEEDGSYEEGEFVADVLRDDPSLRAYQLRDNLIEARHGESLGYGVLQSIAYGVWLKEGLTINAIYACLD